LRVEALSLGWQSHLLACRFGGEFTRFAQELWSRQAESRHVCDCAFNTLGLQRLVMWADPHDVAIGIYRSLGFAQVERHGCLQGRAPHDRR